jgi:hypothetical protein
VLQVPLKWKKTRGGLACDFIGFHFNWADPNFSAGLSESRAKWLSDWLTKVSREGVVVGRAFKGGLGRLVFTAALLRHLLPFLGPLFAWSAVIEPSAVWKVPFGIRTTLRWLARKIDEKPRLPLRTKLKLARRATFAADARADGDEVHVGGYLLGDDLKKVPWFSYALCPKSAPWAFVKKGEAYRTIAALELFATLLCLVLLIPSSREDEGSAELTVVLPGVTDNRGNAMLLDKFMTSKFPLSLILCELSEQLEKRKAVLALSWIKREANQHADDLTNAKYDDFSAELRVTTRLCDIQWIVLTLLHDEASELYKLILDRKSTLTTVAPPTKRRRKGGSGLKFTDPW